LPFLACPTCGGDLSLTAGERATDGHLMTGSLRCPKCRVDFPIRGGIPRLVPGHTTQESSETAARFAFEWKTFDFLADYHEHWLRGWLDPLQPADFAGKNVFEGGCGKGRHSVTVAGWGAKNIVALDLGEAVEVAFGHSRACQSVHVIQGDLLHPPVKRVFDVGFSVGVLHHLPDPHEGFDRL